VRLAPCIPTTRSIFDSLIVFWPEFDENTVLAMTDTLTLPGSSSGRGPRCSGWFADYLAEKGETELQAMTLAGGIKGWVKAGEAYTKNVDGYDPDYWKQFDEQEKK
jgi:hypothetical protein